MRKSQVLLYHQLKFLAPEGWNLAPEGWRVQLRSYEDQSELWLLQRTMGLYTALSLYLWSG